jgi:hypothetical protein
MPAAQEPFATWLARAAYNHLEALLRVEEGPPLRFDVATLFAQIGIVIFLIGRDRLSVARLAWLAVAASALLALIPIPTLFDVAFISDRIPLVAALVLIGSLVVRPGPWLGTDRIAVAALIGIVVVRLGAIAISWHGYGTTYREFVSVAEQIPREKMTIPVMVGSGNHKTKVARTEMYGPLLVIQREQAGPLFSDEKQQPSLLNGPLKSTMDDLASRQESRYQAIPDYYRTMTAASSAGSIIFWTATHSS